MSRKNYRAAALVLKNALGITADKQIVARIARDLASDFKAENSAFRYDRFFEACGLDAFGEVVDSRAEAEESASNLADEVASLSVRDE